MDDDGEIDEDEQDRIIEICAAQTASSCRKEVDTLGSELCALQKSDDDDSDDDYECVAVVRRAGINGNGNYDDGYTAAQNEAKATNDELLTVVGVLGGIIAALIIIIAAGAYFLWRRMKDKNNDRNVHNAVEMVDDHENDHDAQTYGQTINVHDDEEEAVVKQD